MRRNQSLACSGDVSGRHSTLIGSHKIRPLEECRPRCGMTPKTLLQLTSSNKSGTINDVMPYRCSVFKRRSSRRVEVDAMASVSEDALRKMPLHLRR
jgi:hypothetical protein